MITRRRLLSSPLLAGAASLVPRHPGAQSEVAPAQGSSAVLPNSPEVLKTLWTSYYDGTRVWGYADKHSVAPGENFRLMLSTGPERESVKGKIEIFRIGHYGETDRELVWEDDEVEVGRNDAEMTAASLGAGWPLGDDIDTGDWKSGYYTVDFIDSADGQRDLNIAFIVVTNADKSGDILVELSTNTYQAYNAWGGCSLYTSAFAGDRAQMVSFDRPTPPDFFEYEYYFVLWLEQLAAAQNLKIDYATNFDIYRDPVFAEQYKLFVSGSHNEYWSKEEFDAVYRRIFELGKNTLFLGANTAYWQVRYGDLDNNAGGVGRGRQLVCYKDSLDPIRYRVSEREAQLLITAMFRDGSRRPETMLMGVAYQSYFEAESADKYPYFVARTDLPFFAGTGYREGEAIGDVVGYEWDNTDPEADGKRLWDEQKSQIPLLDASLINVVFKGAPVDLNGKQGTAEAVYFVSKAGAKVFSTGSIRWAWGLGKPEFVQDKFKMLNRNLVMHLLQYG